MTETNPSVYRALTSYGALLRDHEANREVTIPGASLLPENIAWIYDERLRGDVPAMISICGRVEAIRDIGDERIAQWQIYCSPSHPRVHDRVAREDTRDLIDHLHLSLTRENPPRGTTYTAHFAVPRAISGRVPEHNFFEASLDAAGWLRERQRRAVRASWNPITHLRHLLGWDHIPDVWNNDPATHRRVRRIVEAHIEPVLMHLWQSWAKDPGVSMLLRGKGIPVTDNRRTQYRPGQGHERILNRLPPAMRQTLFRGEIPDLPDDAIAKMLVPSPRR